MARDVDLQRPDHSSHGRQHLVQRVHGLEGGVLVLDQVAVGYFWHRVPTLEYTPLFIERQIACCGRGHPLYERAGRLDPAEVVDHEWVWRTYPTPEAQHSTTPSKVTAQADNMEAVSLLILSGHHLGYLPQQFAASYIRRGLLAPLNTKMLSYEVTFHVVTRKRSQRGPIVQAFIEDLKRAHLHLQ